MNVGAGEFAFWCLYLDVLEQASREQAERERSAQLHDDAPSSIPVGQVEGRHPDPWWRQRRARKSAKKDFLVG